MPYKDLTKARESKKLWARASRARALNPLPPVERLHPPEPPPRKEPPEWPSDPAGALAAWARDRLIVPPGHPNAGKPMKLPDYLQRFLSDALQAETNEAALLNSRLS